MIFSKVPLAWLQLARNKTRLLVALMGIAFAVILIFMQLAFLNSLYESQTAVHTRLKGDLVMVNANLKTLVNTVDFNRINLYRSLNFPEVKSVNYIYHGQIALKYGNKRGAKGIVTLGINPENSPFDLPTLDPLLSQLLTLDTVIFDAKSDLNEYGDIVGDFNAGKSVTLEAEVRQVHVRGVVDFAGASFGDDGNLIMSTATFQHVTPWRNADKITIGLITLMPGTDPQVAINKIDSQLPPNIRVMTVQDFINLEKKYWSTSAPIGFIFGIGTLVGFLVGVVIVYQVLYNEVNDHLPDYALLKARGYKQRYFSGILFQEASILAVLGYIPGFAISLGLYDVTQSSTALPIYMTLYRGVFVFLLTLAMCFTSGAIAMNKLQEADPADLF